jgi:acetyl esterase/lipase
MAAAEQTPPPSPDLTIDERRKAVRDSCAKASKETVIRHGVVLREIEIAGVPCLRVVPRSVIEGRVILYIFGGGFMMGSPFEDLPIAAALADYVRTPVVCVDYRLAPEHPFPAGLEDVEAVAKALLQGTDKIAFAGESAGGNLALALDQRLAGQGYRRADALAVMSPATDLEDTGDSGIADRDPLLRQARIAEVNAAYAPGRDLTDPELSPIYGQYGDDTPPTMITTGTRDLFLSACVRQERVMRESGAEVTLRVWEGMGHVFEYYPDLPEADLSLREIAGFLDRYL